MIDNRIHQRNHKILLIARWHTSGLVNDLFLYVRDTIVMVRSILWYLDKRDNFKLLNVKKGKITWEV